VTLTVEVVTSTKMASTPFDFNLFSQSELQNAANGLTKSENGLNKDQTIVALLAVNEHLGLPDIVVNGLESAPARKILKRLLDKLPCDIDGVMPIAGVLPDDGKESFVMFGVRDLTTDDQIWVANEAPHTMVFHNSFLNPLDVSAVSLEEIEQTLEPLEYWVAGPSPLAANIGVTEKESERFFHGGKVNVNNFSRFYVSYAPTGRATCYITDALIPWGRSGLVSASSRTTTVIREAHSFVPW
jgi:hypothetical protein